MIIYMGHFDIPMWNSAHPELHQLHPDLGTSQRLSVPVGGLEAPKVDEKNETPTVKFCGI